MFKKLNVFVAIVLLGLATANFWKFGFEYRFLDNLFLGLGVGLSAFADKNAKLGYVSMGLVLIGCIFVIYFWGSK